MDLIKKAIRRRGKRASKEQVIEWVLAAQKGNIEARNNVIVHNLEIMLKFANKYPTMFEDVFQQGVFGLDRAIEKYDVSKGFEFSTYSFHWIKQAMQRYFKDNKSVVRYPIHLQELAHEYKRLAKAMRYEDEQFFIKLISKQLNKKPSTVLAAVRLAKGNPITSIYKYDDGGEEYNLLDIVCPNSQEQFEINPRGILKCLDDREKFIIEKRFAENYTLEEVSLELGITRERVRQIQQKALMKVRSVIKYKDAGMEFD